MPATIFSTAASRYLAENIAQELYGSKQMGHIERWAFDDGEQYYRIGMTERADLCGKDVIFVGSTHTDADLLELYRVGCSLAEHGARRRIFVIPFFGYSTMERAVHPGEVVTAKKNARMLSAIPNSGLGNAFLMLDLHTPGLVHYFEGDSLRYELFCDALLTEAIRDLKLKDFMLASADLGRPRRVQYFAERFDTDIAFVSKSRDRKKTEVLGVVGNVEGKSIVIYDDMTRSGGTLIKAAEAYLQQGAKDVYAVLSHLALYSDTVLDAMQNSPLKKIISTDSHPMSQYKKVGTSSKFIIKPTAPLFANLITQLLT